MSSNEESVWRNLLRKATRGKTKELNTTLIVLGDKSNGKTSLLYKFNDRLGLEERREYVMDYSYVNVKNRANADKEGKARGERAKMRREKGAER